MQFKGAGSPDGVSSAPKLQGQRRGRYSMKGANGLSTVCLRGITGYSNLHKTVEVRSMLSYLTTAEYYNERITY